MWPVLLRILTANVFNGNADASAFGEILDEVDPDLVATQELAPDVAAVIARRLPHGLLHPALDHRGIGLASRAPIDATRHPLPHRDALVGRTDDGIVVWSVHLANPIDLPPAPGRRRAQVHALSEGLAQQLRSGERIVVVGDLNATPVWPAYRRLRRLLDDGVAEWAANTGRRPGRTWSYHTIRVPLLRIDHALTAGVTVASVRTLTVPGSDHRALVVDVE